MAGHPLYLVPEKGVEQLVRFSAAMLAIVARSEGISLTAVWQQKLCLPDLRI
jgi:hypothetical protein